MLGVLADSCSPNAGEADRGIPRAWGQSPQHTQQVLGLQPPLKTNIQTNNNNKENIVDLSNDN